MKILIIGASGLVGSHVYVEAKLRGHEVVGTYRNYPVEGLVKLDLADEDATRELMSKFQPDWVVHAAGWTWVDGCEKDPERAFRENCEQPAFLARHCREQGAHYAYFSTTYVFDGTKSEAYTEEDVPNPINVYGKSKWAAEQRIQEILAGSALIPRVICVWGKEAQKKNFVYQVIKAVREGIVMKVPLDQFGNPTWAGDIAWWLLELMQAKNHGLWNLTGAISNCTRLDWALEILSGIKQYLPNLASVVNEWKYTPIVTSEMTQPASRPLQAGGLNTLIQKRFNKDVLRPCNISVLF